MDQEITPGSERKHPSKIPGWIWVALVVILTAGILFLTQNITSLDEEQPANTTQK